jgi:TonB family protein
MLLLVRLFREATVTQSSGEEILDQAAVRVLRTWRIKPRTYDKVKVPFNFQLKDTSHEQ